MASRSPEFLLQEGIEDENSHKDTTGRRTSLAHSMEADLMLMLAGDQKKIGKIPLYYFYEGNA